MSQEPQIEDAMLAHMLKGGELFGYHMAKSETGVNLMRGANVTHRFARGRDAWAMVRRLITDAKWVELQREWIARLRVV